MLSRNSIIKGLVFIIPILAGILGWLWWALLGPPVVGKGWSYQVWKEDLPEVSALAFDQRGGLYATLELRNGNGKLLHLVSGKEPRVLLGGMNKPDGISRLGDVLYLSNEAGGTPVIEFSRGKKRVIRGPFEVEGIQAIPGAKLLLVEDRSSGGRLIRMAPDSGKMEVLLDDLVQAEGVCQDAHGNIYFTEKTRGLLQKYSAGKRTTVYLLSNPAYLNCVDDGSILITEDHTNFGRLLRFHGGKLTEIASHLRSPQAAIQDDRGTIYLAEQRKNRILRFTRNR